MVPGTIDERGLVERTDPGPDVLVGGRYRVARRIGKHVNGPLEELTDRAELRWDENGIQYRIVLRKEDDEWRVDDIYIRPKPKDDETSSDTSEDDNDI